MSTELIVLIAVIAAVVVIGGVLLMMMTGSKKRHQLQDRFGPEYEYAVSESGSRKEAERELDSRRQRVDRLELRELPSADQGRFLAEWTQIQSRFVDDPYGSIARADRLVVEVMTARGYPMADFDQRAADISVDHPNVVSNYRAAHSIAILDTATTEQLRQALIYYRALFSDMMEPAHATV